MRTGEVIDQIKAETGSTISRSTIKNYRERGLIKAEQNENGEWDYPSSAVKKIILIHYKLTPLGFDLESIKKALRRNTVKKIEKKLVFRSGPDFKKWFDAEAKSQAKKKS